MNDQPNTGNGKVTLPYKWRDEEGELDLTDPNDFEKAKRLVNQGYGYEKGQQELKAVKSEKAELEKSLEYWNGLIDEANQTGDPSKVKAALEMSGIKFDDNSSDQDIVDEGDKKYDELMKKIDSLEGALYTKYTTDAHSQLEAKYNDGNYPEYNRKEVEDFANKKGIRDFEDAYTIMNKDEIIKMQLKQQTDDKKKLSDKVNKVASKDHGAGDIRPPAFEKSKDYGKVGSDWKNDPNITENLFIDE